MKSKDARRKTIIKKIEHEMKKDKANPQRVSNWLKVMESKRKVFTLEDEIDKITRALKSKK
ncbi:MAG: hypothetical protein RAP41_02010 [Candidatus Orphnella occulta]|nr:hypothetical protein [Candidatus Orphnella occulta]MDP8296941.1 hypothetical protein [Candidatus Orphnella occulta]